jgi:hypothetical protein
MRTHARAVWLWSAVLTAALVVTRPLAGGGVTVHEWGTFTSIAGLDGWSVNWAPLAGPQDLPCFVEEQKAITPQGLTSIQIKGRDLLGLLKLLRPLAGTAATAPPPAPAPKPQPAALPPPILTGKIRMETPVLYFYSPAEVTLSVKVSFVQGAMSEWYPTATVSALDLRQPLATTTGTIEWPSVRVRPGAEVALPRTTGESHYYAARDVDASPVQVGGQHERFLFYRGLADFQPPVAATLSSDGVVSISTVPAMPMVLFENRQGQVGYRVVRSAATALERPALTGSVDALRTELAAMLAAEGLYPREARAMVETWRDSWFEEGTRIFYLIPKAAIDARLPLDISPSPASVARVFVGRLELITPEMKDDVERALMANDLDALSRHGRFLDAIVAQIAERPWMASHAAEVANALRAVAAPHATAEPATCQ